MEISDKLSNLHPKSEYERPRNIPSYLDRIKQKSKGTVSIFTNKAKECGVIFYTRLILITENFTK